MEMNLVPLLEQNNYKKKNNTVIVLSHTNGWEIKVTITLLSILG